MEIDSAVIIVRAENIGIGATQYPINAIILADYLLDIFRVIAIHGSEAVYIKGGANKPPPTSGISTQTT